VVKESVKQKINHGMKTKQKQRHGKEEHIIQSRKRERRLHSSLRCKTQRFKWSSCSGASPSQLLCLKTSSYQLIGSKSGGGLDTGLAKRRALFPEGRGLGVGGRKRKKKRKSKSPWTAFHGSLVLHNASQKENPTHFK
jgi:hypothetical protein